MHWDMQLFKALEHQYQMGLERLHKELPHIQCDLDFKNRQVLSCQSSLCLSGAAYAEPSPHTARHIPPAHPSGAFPKSATARRVRDMTARRVRHVAKSWRTCVAKRTSNLRCVLAPHGACCRASHAPRTSSRRYSSALPSRSSAPLSIARSRTSSGSRQDSRGLATSKIPR